MQKKEDQIISIKYNQKTYKLRVVRFLLTSGEEEILITSLCVIEEHYNI